VVKETPVSPSNRTSYYDDDDDNDDDDYYCYYRDSISQNANLDMANLLDLHIAVDSPAENDIIAENAQQKQEPEA